VSVDRRGIRVLLHRDALREPKPERRLAAQILSFLTTVVQASCALLWVYDGRLQAQEVLTIGEKLEARGPAQVIARYLEEFEPIDPFAPRRFVNTSATLVSSRDIAPAEVLSGSRYVREHLGSLGLQHKASLYLRHHGRLAASITLLRACGDYDFQDRELHFLRLIHPVCQTIIEAMLTGRDVVGSEPAVFDDSLTPREMDVAGLVCSGATNQEIATALFITQGTVKTHLNRVFVKLGIRSRTQLALHLMSRSTRSTLIDAPSGTGEYRK
jgi:DNA-binding NarL/FixJ family response regulator